jgi:hypothetical protein
MAMFVLVVDTSLMNVSISPVVHDLNTTVNGVQSAIALEGARVGRDHSDRQQDLRPVGAQARVHTRIALLRGGRHRDDVCTGSYGRHRVLALQVALIVPVLAGLLGLVNGLRMRQLPDPKPSAPEGTAFG